MEFIENLKELLQQKGMSKNKLAQEIGISEGTIRSWENGKYPTIEKLIKISQYFTISTDDLLGLSKIKYTEEERLIINAYKKANKITQENIQSILKIEKNTNDKSESLTSKIG